MKKKSTWLWLIAIISVGLAEVSCVDGNDTTTPAHSHNWGGWTETTAATCSAKGVETRACSGCSEKQTQDIGINSANHDL